MQAVLSIVLLVVGVVSCKGLNAGYGNELAVLEYYLSAGESFITVENGMNVSHSVRLSEEKYFQEFAKCNWWDPWCIRNINENFVSAINSLWTPKLISPNDPLYRVQRDCLYSVSLESIFVEKFRHSKGGQPAERANSFSSKLRDAEVNEFLVYSFVITQPLSNCSSNFSFSPGGSTFVSMAYNPSIGMTSCETIDHLNGEYQLHCRLPLFDQASYLLPACISLTLLLEYEHFDAFSVKLASSHMEDFLYPVLRSVLVDNQTYCSEHTAVHIIGSSSDHSTDHLHITHNHQHLLGSRSKASTIPLDNPEVKSSDKQPFGSNRKRRLLSTARSSSSFPVILHAENPIQIFSGYWVSRMSLRNRSLSFFEQMTNYRPPTQYFFTGLAGRRIKYDENPLYLPHLTFPKVTTVPFNELGEDMIFRATLLTEDNKVLDLTHPSLERWDEHNISSNHPDYSNYSLRYLNSSPFQSRHDVVNSSSERKPEMIYHFYGESHMRYAFDNIIGKLMGESVLAPTRKHLELKIENFRFEGDIGREWDHRPRIEMLSQNMRNLCLNNFNSTESPPEAEHTILLQTGSWALWQSPVQFLIKGRSGQSLLQVLRDILTGELPCHNLRHIVLVTSMPYPMCFDDRDDKCFQLRGFNNNGAEAAFNRYLIDYLRHGFVHVHDASGSSQVPYTEDFKVRLSIVDAFAITKSRLLLTNDAETACNTHYFCRESIRKVMHNVVTPAGSAILEAMYRALSLPLEHTEAHR